MTTPTKPYVLVRWEDAHGSGDDLSEQSLKHRPMIFRSPGWCFRSDEVGVSLAVEWCESDDTYRGHTFIPRKLVISESPFAKPRKRKVTP